MNVYFVDFFAIYEWLSFTTNVLCNLSNASKGKIVANVIYN
jgi:hypothetical protein